MTTTDDTLTRYNSVKFIGIFRGHQATAMVRHKERHECPYDLMVMYSAEQLYNGTLQTRWTCLSGDHSEYITDESN